MDLFGVTYYFLSTVTLKDLFPGLKKIFSLSRIIFCPLSHKRIFSLLYKKIFFMSRIYFCPVSHWKIFFLLLKRSFLCHIICFCSKVTEVSGVLILKKIRVIFSASSFSAVIFKYWSDVSEPVMNSCWWLGPIRGCRHFTSKMMETWWYLSGSSVYFQIWKAWLC